MAKSFAEIAQRGLRTAEGKNDSRTKLVRAIRAACNRLGLDDDARRDIHLALTGKRSTTQMTFAELGQVLDRLNKDWKGPSGHRAHIGKIRALWWTLYWLGAVAEPNDHAIDAFVRRQTGVSALSFLDHRSASAVVEGLKSWAAREGVRWEKEPGELGDRRAVADAIWRKLRETGAAWGSWYQLYAAEALKVSPQPEDWSRHEWDAVIKLLGKRLRRTQGRKAVD
ncbi:MAG TPA: regulatory protein GemA [Sphingomonas sp.]|nr:regulatory protein GemA [Sphingomonas sp.]